MSTLFIFEKDAVDFTTRGLGSLPDVIIDTPPKVIEKMNSEFSLSFEYPYEGRNFNLIEEERIVKASTPAGYQPFRIYRVVKDLENITVYANHVFYDLGGNFIEDTFIQGRTGQEAIQQVLSKSIIPHSFTASSNIAETMNSRIVRKNTVEAILGDIDNSLINRGGGEVSFDGFHINWMARRGSDKGFTVKYRKNLTGLNFSTDYSTVVTRIQPIGFDGLLLPEKYVDSPLVDNYSTVIVREIRYGDIISKDISPDSEEAVDHEVALNKLRNYASKEFENGIDKPTVECDINFIDLSQTEEYKNYAHLQSLQMGDDVSIVATPFGVDVKKRMVYYEWDAYKDRYIEIALSEGVEATYRMGLTGTINSIVNNNLDKIYNDLNTQINTVRLSADGKNTIYTGPDKPAKGKLGDIWFKIDPDGKETLMKFDGVRWYDPLQLDQLKKDLESSKLAIDEAKIQADKAVADAEALNTKIDNLGDVSEALSQLDEAQSRIDQMEIEISQALGGIKADFYGDMPVPPYELNQKWYKDAYDFTQAYDLFPDTQGTFVTLNTFMNSALLICINPKAEGEAFSWADWKVVVVDTYTILQDLSSEFQKESEATSSEFANVYGEIIKKVNDNDFKIVKDEVDQQGILIGKLEEKDGTLEGSINDISNTATESKQVLINLIGQNPDGTFKVAEYNQKISDATQEISELWKDKDPLNTDPNSSGYLINQTKKTAEQTLESLKDYSKTADMESYVSNEIKETADSITTTLANYSKTADMEAYALLVAKQEAGKVSTSLKDYVKTATLDEKGYITMSNINNAVQTTTGNYTTLAEYINGELSKLNDVKQTVDGTVKTLADYDLDGSKGSTSIATIRETLQNHATQFATLPSNVSGAVKVGADGLPIPPFEKGAVWYKDAYSFTQAYDKFPTGQNPTLNQFMNAGIWISKVARAAGTAFNWNDWECYSMDQSFQLSEIYQDIETIATTVQSNETNSLSRYTQLSSMIDMTVTKDGLIGQINTQAGNVLIRAGDDGKTSILNITKEGTYIEKGIIDSVHIGESVINTSHIGDLTFDWAVGKTLNADLINLINLNANSIVAGKIRGYLGFWDLDRGNFVTGSDTGSKIQLFNGVLTSSHAGNKRYELDYYGLKVYQSDGEGINIGYIGGSTTTTPGAGTYYSFMMGHKNQSVLSLAYRNYERSLELGRDSYDPYLTFDIFDIDRPDSSYAITAWERVLFQKRTKFMAYARFDEGILFRDGDIIMQKWQNLENGAVGVEIKMVGSGNGFGFELKTGEIYKVTNNVWAEKVL